jgi:hypothetical protein
MVGLFFIGLACTISGIIIAAVFENYNNIKGAIASLIIGFVLTIFCWTICCMYDSPQEFLARLKYDNIRSFYVLENSIENFDIDLKDSNIIYAKHLKTCKEHGSMSTKCNKNCEYENLIHVIAYKNEIMKSKYDMLIEKERK